MGNTDQEADFMPDTVVDIPLPASDITVPQILQYILLVLLCVFLNYVLQLLPRCIDFIYNRVEEVKTAGREAWRKPRTARKALISVVRLLRRWEIFTVPGITFVLIYYCAINLLSDLPAFYANPGNIELWTLQEQKIDLTRTGVSATAPVRDPRSSSPFDPLSYQTTHHFCGRPTASSYDGYMGAAHATYIQHDMNRDRFVVRTFGRGGTRVDHRRRMGIGRSTYETFCGVSVEAQTNTPLAPTSLQKGSDNWQVNNSAARASRHANAGAFNFSVEELARPLAHRDAANPWRDNFLKEDQTLRTHYKRYTRPEILAKHRTLDFIYSYVNGSDVTRGYTKPFAKDYICWNLIAAVQVMWGELQRQDSDGNTRTRISEDVFSRYASELLFATSHSPCSMVRLLSDAGAGKDAMTQVQQSLWWATRHVPSNTSEAAGVPTPFRLTNIELLRAIGAERDTFWMDDIDTDCDELRHSMRGLLEHTRLWNRGRLTVVSPYSNVPLWLNQSRNFFLRSLYSDTSTRGVGVADALGPLSSADYRFAREVYTQKLHYTRLHVVDQRALMPPAPITTVNSYVIEPFIYRLHNVSSVFVYMNDDYLIMKDVDVSDFVNAFGGPVLRISDEDDMEYYESNVDYFRRGFIFNTMRMHRDVDKLPADVEELMQPSAMADAVVHESGEAPQLHRGIVRGDWAAFTAAVNTPRVSEPSGRAEGSLNGTVDAWAACARQGTEAGGAFCELPRVSIAGESAWQVDAAGAFQLVTTADAKRVWTGQAQTPRIGKWGGRVLDRISADFVAPRYYLGTETVVLGESEARPASPAEMLSRLRVKVSAAEKAIYQISEAPENDDDVRGKLMHVFTSFMDFILEHEFSTHRIFKTQPRLRKYRVRLDSHAPYPQCRNMWHFIHKRYAPELNLNMFLMRKRTTLDFLPPSTHTMHMLRHPWAGSNQYIPYLMAKEAWRLQVAENMSRGIETTMFPVMDVTLDNEDGCAPATYVAEALDSARYHEFRNSVQKNKRTMAKIRSYRGRMPFTNINSKFTVASVGVTLRNFLEELFPTPMLFEAGWKTTKKRRRQTSTLNLHANADSTRGAVFSFYNVEEAFKRLNRLPLILVSNDEEGFCPLLRSLRHAMPDFRGLRVVQVLVPPADGRTLYAARAEVRHAYRNFLPVTRCTLPPGRLTRVTLAANSSEADIIVAGLRSAREGLAKKYWAAPALVELRGLRVSRRAVQAVVLDARTLRSAAAGFTELPRALATPAELLAHEDFTEVLLNGENYRAAEPFVQMPTQAEAAAPAVATLKGEKARALEGADYTGSVLVLSEADAKLRNVHWAYGASEHDLLSGMPLPYLRLEDRDANVKWGY